MSSRYAQRRRLPSVPPPPYGRELLALRAQGLVPGNGTVFIGLDDWKHGGRYWRAVVPKDADPAGLNYAFVAGLAAIIGWTPEVTTLARRDTLIRAVLAYLPASLRVITFGDPIEWTWIKSQKVGIELAEFRE